METSGTCFSEAWLVPVLVGQKKKKKTQPNVKSKQGTSDLQVNALIITPRWHTDKKYGLELWNTELNNIFFKKTLGMKYETIWMKNVNMTQSLWKKHEISRVNMMFGFYWD